MSKTTATAKAKASKAAAPAPEPLKLTAPQVALLAHLAAGNVITSPLPRSGLSENGNFYRSPGYAGRIRYDQIDRLENAGFITVKESGKGQRITITPAGRRAIR